MLVGSAMHHSNLQEGSHPCAHLHEQEKGFIDEGQQHAIDQEPGPVLGDACLHAQVLGQGKRGSKHLHACCAEAVAF